MRDLRLLCAPLPSNRRFVCSRIVMSHIWHVAASVWQMELHVGGVDLAGEDAASRAPLLMVFFCALLSTASSSRFPMRGALFRFRYGHTALA